MSLAINEGWSAARVCSVADYKEISTIYGKEPYYIHPPRGYKLTGEFRFPKSTEIYLGTMGNVLIGTSFIDIPGPRLILQSSKAEAKSNPPAAPVAQGYTAAEVIERYGKDVLTLVFGKRTELKDCEGFTYTGKIEHVPVGQWYFNVADKRPVQVTERSWLIEGKSGFLVISLHKLPQPTPRIINYLKREAASFLDDEAAYLPNEKGEMFAVDRNEVTEEYFWERQEVA